jgi:hypothetical protein
MRSLSNFLNRARAFLIKFPRPTKKTLLLILVVAAITLLFSALISMWLSKFDNLHIPSVGTLRTIGVEAYGGNITIDEQGNQYINWSSIYTGAAENRSFYLRSKSNVKTILNLTTANWTFYDTENKIVIGFNASYLNLGWDYNNTLISYPEEIYVTLTLKVSVDSSFINALITNKVEKFSFDIIISAKEYKS